MTSWRTRAACLGLDPDMFFPGRGESISKAKAICADCPVSDDCLDWAMRTLETKDPGLFGGLTQAERARLRKRRWQQARRAQARAS